MLSRRGFLQGLVAAPAIIKTPGLLMPVKPIAYYPYTEYELALLVAKAKVRQMAVEIASVQPIYTPELAKTLFEGMRYGG